jgi:hypothetical protein
MARISIQLLSRLGDETAATHVGDRRPVGDLAAMHGYGWILGGAFFLAMVLVGAHRCRQGLLM